MFPSPAAHLLCLLGLTGSVVRGQTITRIAESSDDGADYTGEIHQFSEIGHGGVGSPRPWICYTSDATNVIWERPDGVAITSGTGQATGSQLFMRVISFGVILHRGTGYNSPDGEYCCVWTTTNERRCVTLTPCPMLITPPHGQITYDVNTSMATYSCDTGYVVTGTSPITCDEGTGQWSDTPPTCQATCPDLPTLTNGVISYSPSTTPRLEGTVATHSCDVGYSLSGGTERTCQSDRTWSGGEITCIVSCSDLTLDNGMIVYTPPGSPILAGTIATHSCSHGYLLTGDVNRTCVSQNGGRVWSGGQLTCRAICDDLPTITNGVITYSLSTIPILMDTTATYTCLFGLPLMGGGQRVCLGDRSWSGTEPYCQRVFVQLGGTSYLSGDSELTISDVGVGDGGLVCRTDHPQCCGTSSDANWLGPNNTVISSTPGAGDFFVTRGDGSITLNRVCNARTTTGTYCCSVPVDGNSTEMFCVVLTPQGQRPAAIGDSTVGLSVAIVIILVAYLTTVVILVTLLIIRTRQLQTARTQLSQYSKQKVYETPDQAFYEDVSKVDAGGTDHIHIPAMELNQCPAYAPNEVLTQQKR